MTAAPNPSFAHREIVWRLAAEHFDISYEDALATVQSQDDYTTAKTREAIARLEEETKTYENYRDMTEEALVQSFAMVRESALAAHDRDMAEHAAHRAKANEARRAMLAAPPTSGATQNLMTRLRSMAAAAADSGEPEAPYILLQSAEEWRFSRKNQAKKTLNTTAERVRSLRQRDATILENLLALHQDYPAPLPIAERPQEMP